MTPSAPALVACDAARTAQLLDFHSLMAALAQAAAQVEAGTLRSPPRMVLPLGAGGVLLSMPATAPDIAIHKLVTVQAANNTASTMLILERRCSATMSAVGIIASTFIELLITITNNRTRWYDCQGAQSSSQSCPQTRSTADRGTGGPT